MLNPYAIHFTLYPSVTTTMSGTHEASTYPNGKRKSDLYDYFLTHWDFACNQDDYKMDLELIRAEEQQNLWNCSCCRDTDGKLVVSGLDLQDKATRVLITHDGFVVDLKVGRLVFISYAREDIAAARLIKEAIDQAGLVAWLDERYLRGGVRWKAKIPSMIRSADFFVTVLSTLSLGKRGFVQREIREALDVALSVPDSRVFIVPVRLNHCEPTHPALQELNWVDLFPDWDAGVHRLIQSLHAALDQT